MMLSGYLTETQDFDSGIRMCPAVTEAATRTSGSLPRQKELTPVQRHLRRHVCMYVYIYIYSEREVYI